jgi:hypothetical protein
MEVREHSLILSLGRLQGLLREVLLVVLGNQNCLVFWGHVADAQRGSVVGLLVDDDVLLLQVVVVVVLIHGKVLDRVGLPRLVHAEEGRSAASGVFLAEEVVLELLALDALRIPPPLLALVD